MKQTPEEIELCKAYMRHECAACLGYVKNSVAHYNIAGNYCSKCSGKIDKLGKTRTFISTAERNLRETSDPNMVEYLNRELERLRKELRAIKDYFPVFIDDIGPLLI